MTSTESIWTVFSGRLRSYVAKHVREESDVEDVLQDVFAKIHGGLSRLKETERLEAWLFQVTRRAILDHFRSRSGKRRSVALPKDLASDSPATGISIKVASWLEPMMALVPEEDRDVLRLADLDGLVQKDLAKRLGVSVTAAKSRVQRARKRLKKAVLDCCHIEKDRRGNAIEYTRKRSDCGPCSCS